MSLNEVIFDASDFESLATYADRLAETEIVIAHQKQKQDDIFNDAANSLESKGLKKADAKKIVKATYELSKTNKKLDEFETLASIGESASEFMKKDTV